MLIGCTNESSHETNIDWDAVNRAFEEYGVYKASSIAEAEKIVDYSIATLEDVPEEFSEEPVVTVSPNVSPSEKINENPPMEVQQTWNHQQERYYMMLTIKPYRASIGGDNVNEIEINGMEVQAQRIDNSSNDRPDVFSMMWFDGELNYHLVGFISETLTEETYTGLVESLIN